MGFASRLVAACLAAGSTLGHAQTQYLITRIDPPPGLGPSSVATAISPGGVVAGYSPTGTSMRPFIYSGGAAQAFGLLQGYTDTTLSAINDQGQIAGTASLFSGPRTAFVYANGAYTDLRTLTGGAGSVAADINAAGAVVGSVDGVMGPGWAYLYENGVLTNLGTLPGYGGSEATAINAAGHVAGNSYEPSFGFGQAFIRIGGTLQSIGRLAGAQGSLAYDLNDSDHVVGTSGNSAFLYANGTMIDLGALPGDVSATAWSVNNSDVVIGNSLTATNSYRGFVYRDGVMSDLTSLVQNGEGWVLTAPAEINDAGQIVGYGLYHGEGRGFLLTPVSSVPGPATWLLLLAGLPLVVGRRARTA